MSLEYNRKKQGQGSSPAELPFWWEESEQQDRGDYQGHVRRKRTQEGGQRSLFEVISESCHPGAKRSPP